MKRTNIPGPNLLTSLLNLRRSLRPHPLPSRLPSEPATPTLTVLLKAMVSRLIDISSRDPADTEVLLKATAHPNLTEATTDNSSLLATDVPSRPLLFLREDAPANRSAPRDPALSLSDLAPAMVANRCVPLRALASRDRDSPAATVPSSSSAALSPARSPEKRLLEDLHTLLARDPRLLRDAQASRLLAARADVLRATDAAMEADPRAPTTEYLHLSNAKIDTLSSSYVK